VDADDVQRPSEDVESVADTDARVLRQHPIDVDPAGWNRVRAVPHPQRHREDVIGVAVQVEGDVSRVDRDRSAHARDVRRARSVTEWQERGRVKRVARRRLGQPQLAR